MNLQQILTSMGLSWTSLIEYIIFLLFFFIFNFWLNLILFLVFYGYVGFKTYLFIKNQKLAYRNNLFTQNLPKLMRAA